MADEAKRRRGTEKGGPRVITFTPAVAVGSIVPVALSNCRNCTVPAGNTVFGEDGTVDSVALLVHSWYWIETDVDIFWRQLNPRDACAAVDNTLAIPFLLRTGSKLRAGTREFFFVDHSIIDGVIAVFFCAQTAPDPCVEITPPPEGFTRVIRKDSILLMEETKDNVSIMAPTPASGICE